MQQHLIPRKMDLRLFKTPRTPCVSLHPYRMTSSQLYLPHLWRRSEQVHWQGLWRCQLKGSQEMFQLQKSDEWWADRLCCFVSISKMIFSICLNVNNPTKRPKPTTNQTLWGFLSGSQLRSTYLKGCHSWAADEVCRPSSETKRAAGRSESQSLIKLDSSLTTKTDWTYK